VNRRRSAGCTPHCNVPCPRFRHLSGRAGILSCRSERHRIHIARVLVAQPRILVLDKPRDWTMSPKQTSRKTSASFAGRRRYHYAHRYSMVRDADHVIVLAKTGGREGTGHLFGKRRLLPWHVRPRLTRMRKEDAESTVRGPEDDGKKNRSPFFMESGLFLIFTLRANIYYPGQTCFFLLLLTRHPSSRAATGRCRYACLPCRQKAEKLLARGSNRYVSERLQRLTRSPSVI